MCPPDRWDNGFACMAANQCLEVNAITIKTFSLVLFEGCQRKSIYVRWGEYGEKYRKKENQEVQKAGIQISGKKKEPRGRLKFKFILWGAYTRAFVRSWDCWCLSSWNSIYSFFLTLSSAISFKALAPHNVSERRAKLPKKGPPSWLHPAMLLTAPCYPPAKWHTDANTGASSAGGALERPERPASAFSVHSRSWSSRPLGHHANTSCCKSHWALLRQLYSF